jgi:hypothetical protein
MFERKGGLHMLYIVSTQDSIQLAFELALLMAVNNPFAAVITQGCSALYTVIKHCAYCVKK